MSKNAQSTASRRPDRPEPPSRRRRRVAAGLVLVGLQTTGGCGSAVPSALSRAGGPADPASPSRTDGMVTGVLVNGQDHFPVGGQLISLLADSSSPCPRSADLPLVVRS